MSLITISKSGTIKACFLFKYTPANKAIAATGVKFAVCGTNLNNIPTIIRLIANILLPPFIICNTKANPIYCQVKVFKLSPDAMG